MSKCVQMCSCVVQLHECASFVGSTSSDCILPVSCHCEVLKTHSETRRSTNAHNYY